MRALRGLFLVLILVSVLPASSVGAQSSVLPYNLAEDAYTAVAVEAADKAAKSFNNQAYNWKKNAHCSTYASRYISKLGMPISEPADYAESMVTTFPYANTVFQVTWLEKHYGGSDFLKKVTVDDLLSGKLWGEIKPGSVIYFQTWSNHNGNNAYDHVVVLLGFNKENEPIFAEFVPAMKHGPELGRTLEQVAFMYKPLGPGKWNLSPYDEKEKGKITPDFLYATVFDAIGASKDLKEQQARLNKVMQDYFDRKKLAEASNLLPYLK
jgi:hypothetical protein